MQHFRDVYADRLLTLSQQEVELVVSRVNTSRIIAPQLRNLPDGVTPSILPSELNSRGILAADVVTVLLSVDTPVAQNAIEKIIARQIQILPPQPSPPPAPKHEGAPAPSEDAGPNSRRFILDIVANPKRSGTGAHERFNLYREGMSVAEYLRLGGQVRDICWDARQGFIRVTGDGPITADPVVGEVAA